MSIIRLKSIPLLMLTILLGAVLSVLCMATATNTLHRPTHQHGMVHISCAQDEAPVNGCTPAHSLLIHTLTQASGRAAAAFYFLALIFAAFYASRGTQSKNIGKQFYKTRRQITQQVYAEHILHWLSILRKQDSYVVAAV